jgi:vesicle-associated membrane protein 4
MASTGESPPYDPYIPADGAGRAGAQPAPGNQRTAALQAVSDSSIRIG